MSQKTDNLIKLALVFFVSLLSFSIGTYVGKKYSDNQHKLSMLEPKKESAPTHAEEFATETATESNTAATAPAAGSEDLTASQQKPAALTDSEVAKIAEEFATEEDAAEEKVVATIDGSEKEVKTITNSAKPVTEAKSAPAPAVKVAPAAVVAKAAIQKAGPLPAKITATAAATVKPTEKISATPVDAPSDERLPASIPAKAEITPLHFTVQIGSFPTVEEAEKMTKALQNKGYKTSFVPAKVNGQSWYRVNVGLFGTIREAQDYKKEFLQKTQLSSAIVQRVQE